MIWILDKLDQKCSTGTRFSVSFEGKSSFGFLFRRNRQKRNRKLMPLFDVIRKD